MTGCDAYGDLLGGYVLGALEADEVETMRHHLETCRACAAEHAALAGLPVLLNAVEPSDVPPPQPSPALEERVLDHWARERRESHVAGEGRDVAAQRGGSAPEPGAAPRRGTRRGARGLARWWRPATGVAALAAVVAVALAIALPGDGDEPYAHGTLRPAAGAANAWGTFTVENVSAGTRVYLSADRLPARGDYEVWCVRSDGRWISGGSFRPRADGSAAATLTAAVEPGEYHHVVVTQGGDEGERGPEVLRGKLVY